MLSKLTVSIFKIGSIINYYYNNVYYLLTHLSPIKIKDNNMSLIYFHSNKKFKQVWKIQKGPIDFIQAKGIGNSYSGDITEELCEYINPENKICSNLVTPFFLSAELNLDFNKVEIYYFNNTISTFCDKEPIII